MSVTKRASRTKSINSSFGEESPLTPQTVSVFLRTEGSLPNNEDCNLFVFFNGTTMLETPWSPETTYEIEALPVDLVFLDQQRLIADYPLVILLRGINAGGKAVKDADPLLHPDNRAGAAVDLFPILLGQDQIYLGVYLILLNTGELSGCKVTVFSACTAITEKLQEPLTMTMVSAHCLPPAKEGTVYLGAIGLDEITENISYSFGTSLSSSTAKKVVWALANNGSLFSNTDYNIIHDDKFVPEDLEIQTNPSCTAFFWNSMRRVLVDPISLRERLTSPFLIEIAGVPRIGKVDVRGRYMGLIDAGVLLQPGISSVTTCAKLFFYKEANLPEGLGPLLQLPPTSAKASAREKDIDEIFDEHGHSAYVVIRFDLPEPLIPKPTISALFDTIGISVLDESKTNPLDELYLEPPPKDTLVDMRKIRAEGGALAVHNELSVLASSIKANVPSNQNVKRTAANRLLLKVRTMLKQFEPEEGCSNAEWQDTVSAHHAAGRRAVMASFEPRPPPRAPLLRAAETRSRMAGDTRIANYHLINKLKNIPNHPRTILSNVLRSLECGKMDVCFDLIRSLQGQCKNKFVLWILGAQEFEKEEGNDMAVAALRIPLEEDTSAGTSNSIGWAALHALYHHNANTHAAFIASLRMRKAFELHIEWKKFYENWKEISGEEEIYWLPTAIGSENPFILAAAFFLCLRCFNMTERLLLCAEENCLTRGSRNDLTSNITTDNYYIRAAMHLITNEVEKALGTTDQGIKRFGPTAMMTEMRANCLMKSQTWDDTCTTAVWDAERAGAKLNPSLLLRAALSAYRRDPVMALQWAARCHKKAPSAFSALTLAKIYDVINKNSLAERWAAAAVKLEPLLADGWAFLCILAMRDKNVDLARHLFRTAKQVGPISDELMEEIKKLKSVTDIETLPQTVMSEICFCTDCF